MPIRNFQQLPSYLVRIHRACRIVRVDEDDGTGAGSDLAAEMVEIRPPPA